MEEKRERWEEHFCLDREDVVQAGDRAGMLDTALHMPAFCREAWRLGLEAPLPATPWGGFKEVLICGMGGSAIGGDILRAYAQSRASIPFFINRHYTLPAWVSSRTLLVFVSYSGDTEETIAAYHEGVRGKRVVITSGGTIANLAFQAEEPLIIIPPGIPARSALPFLLIPILVLLARLDILPEAMAELEPILNALHQMLQKAAPNIPTAENPAKQLASSLYQRLPIVWGVEGTTQAVAYRLKGQLNENSKSPAWCSLLPELNHNEIVGTEALPEVLERCCVVMLKDLADHRRVQKQLDITKALVKPRVGEIVELRGEGETLLSRIFSLILLGDLASIYLAILYKIDPGPIRLIKDLKAEMAKDQERT